jgi:hypothetical protein
MHSLSAAQWAVRFFQRGSDLLERVELSGEDVLTSSQL